MVSQEATQLQNKIIGVALRDARTRAGKSLEACAEILSCPVDELAQAEMGQASLSLPQLEALAHFLNTPVHYLLGEELPADSERDDDHFAYDNVMIVRRKIIGLILRQTRLNFGRTLDDVASAIGYTSERLARVELGEELLSVVELRVLAAQLGISFETFLEEDITPLTPAERDARDLRRLAHLSPDVREFILKPINAPYLQIAMNLSSIPSEALRQIASGLLEITY